VSTSDTMKVRLFPPLITVFIESLEKVISECLRAKYWCFCS